MTDDSNLVPVSPVGEVVKKTDINWSPVLALVYALVAFGLVTQLVAPVILYSVLVASGQSTQQAVHSLQNGIVWQFMYVVLAEGALFGAIWWFLRKHKRSLRTIGWRRPRWSDLLATLAGFAVYFIGYVVLVTLVSRYVHSFNANQKQELGFDDVAGSYNLLLTFVSLVVLPPIVEETVFRGFIFTSLRKKWKFWGATLGTSLLFAVAHLEFGSGKSLVWVAALDTFTLSLVLCYLREKTDSLWPGILLHALKNSLAFISLYIIHLS